MASHRFPRAWRAALCAILLLVPVEVLAWNAGGHRLTASMAWDRMDPATRQGISGLLRLHPDHERWLARHREGDPDRTAFVEASTWPDDIRADKRFYDAGIDERTATLPGFPDMERRRHWHYVDRPLGFAPRGRPSRGALDRQLAALAKTLADPKAQTLQRVYALPWLIHLVGDAHQPLHAVSRYDADGQGDEGGNRLTVATPFHPRLSTMSLHGYWDDLPAPPWLRGSRLETAARALAARYPAGESSGEPEAWLAESREIAHDSGYPAGDEIPPTLSREFHEAAQETARRRVAQAGYRLADLLQRLLRDRRKRRIVTRFGTPFPTPRRST